MNEIIKRIQDLNLPYKFQTNVKISETSWFGVGGICDVVFKVSEIDTLEKILKSIPRDISILPIGVTSNLLVRDDGFRGVIIKSRFFDLKILDDFKVEVGSGLLDANVAKYCAEHEISGLEFLYTIPGTIGGAIAMNAGCYGKEISDILISAKGVDICSGEIKIFERNEIDFSYRNNPIKNIIWVNAIFQGYFKDRNAIEKTMDYFYQQRIDSQPKSCKTGGSTFCNPDGHSAWKLIDEVGLRGYRIGGACFSEKHCNFIINDKNATAQDIIDLIELAERKVFEKFGIKLKREILII